MTSRIVHDLELENVLGYMAGRWGGVPGAELALFKNDFDPGPSSLAAAFIEADYAGYARVLLSGKLTAPAKVAAGFFEVVSDVFIFLPPTTGPGNVIYGGFVLLGGVAVGSQRFTASLPMQIGSVPFSLRLRLTTKSESLFLIE